MTHSHRLTLALILVMAAPALAQTTVGFTDPDDTGNLLDYRLPDWTWRTWDGAFDLHGDGYSQGENSSANHRLRISSDLAWARESEQLWWYATWDSEIQGSTFDDQRDDLERNGDQFSTAHMGRGTMGRYLGDSPFYVLAEVATSWSYGVSDIEDPRSGDRKNYDRRFDTSAELGFGIGRLRNITPVIWAQRINERLVTLGRAPLSRSQVQAVAVAATKETGYRRVYERSDRRFWEAILAPVLDPERPLSPYEVEYLREVSIEEGYARYEGARVSFTGRWDESRQNGDTTMDSTMVSRKAAPHAWTGEVDAEWAHNPSLVTQFQLRARVNYADGGSLYSFEQQSGTASLWGSWRRDVTDRQQLAVSVGTRGTYGESATGEIRRSLRSSFSISDRIWVEDSFTLRPFIRAEYSGYSANMGWHRDPSYQWSYGVDFAYNFDSVLD